MDLWDTVPQTVAHKACLPSPLRPSGLLVMRHVAGWIHGIEGNPIAELARQHGLTLHSIPLDTVIHGPDGRPVPDQADRDVEVLFNQLLEQTKQVFPSPFP